MRFLHTALTLEVAHTHATAFKFRETKEHFLEYSDNDLYSSLLIAAHLNFNRRLGCIRRKAERLEHIFKRTINGPRDIYTKLCCFAHRKILFCLSMLTS